MAKDRKPIAKDKILISSELNNFVMLGLYILLVIAITNEEKN
ncbi:hypothetical protein [Okeania sp. SIO3B5]|nr:hypothetical protein [Okeania sp. SIO3B5]